MDVGTLSLLGRNDGFGRNYSCDVTHNGFATVPALPPLAEWKHYFLLPVDGCESAATSETKTKPVSVKFLLLLDWSLEKLVVFRENRVT